MASFSHIYLFIDINIDLLQGLSRIAATISKVWAISSVG